MSKAPAPAPRRWAALVLALLTTVAFQAFAARTARADTLTLQQGTDSYGGCTDSWLRTWYGNTGPSASYVPPKNQHDNYGDATGLDIRYYYSSTCPKCPKIGRIVVGFNLSRIPSGSTILSARLEMKVALNQAKAAMDLLAYRVTSQWDEDEVSWLDRTAANDWDTEGGDYDGTLLDSREDQPAGSWVHWDVLDAVRAWKEDGIPNRGILIRTPENTGTGYGYTDPEGTMLRFHSSEATPAGNRPKLVVTYNPPDKDAGPSTGPDAGPNDGGIPDETGTAETGGNDDAGGAGQDGSDPVVTTDSGMVGQDGATQDGSSAPSTDSGPAERDAASKEASASPTHDGEDAESDWDRGDPGAGCACSLAHAPSTAEPGAALLLLLLLAAMRRLS